MEENIFEEYRKIIFVDIVIGYVFVAVSGLKLFKLNSFVDTNSYILRGYKNKYEAIWISR